MDQIQIPDRRLELHKILCDILGSDQVYFQPPASIQMQYPAIVYNLDNLWRFEADNKAYIGVRRYQITVIDANPDSELIGKVGALPKCSYNRHYAQDNLNHDVFTIYF